MPAHRPSARGVAPAALCAAILMGCSGARAPESPAGEPYVTGPLESITARATATGLLVRPGPGSPDACGINAVADARTRFLRRTGTGEWRPAALSDLSPGDTVEVYVDGPVARSCPAQGRASAVVLVSRDGS